mmetsp:Transcript_32885/g.96811  ORF Transcript_32885/g.96811 Transcript_32885/m.96811 type:complete len:459 (-) Transcript_32885:14-1390(-)
MSLVWAGSFITEAPTLGWISQKVGGSYAAPSMRMAVLELNGTTVAALEDARSRAELLLSSTCDERHDGDTLRAEACSDLIFDEGVWQTTYRMAVPGRQFGVFADNLPITFEQDSHYLKTLDGANLEPIAELPEAPDDPIPWAEGIGAAFAVNCITFSGVVFLGPGLRKLYHRHERRFLIIMSAFAAGALLAAAFYLILFEATHLVGTSSKDESVVTARWGSMVLLGFIAPSLFELAVQLLRFVLASSSFSEGASRRSPSQDPAGLLSTCCCRKVEANDPCPVEPKSITVADPTNRIRVLSGVLIGDLMHNFCDGIFMATGFRYCGSSLAWSIATATIFHEIAQELSDFLILTNSAQGGLKVPLALLLNFVSGTGVLWGTVLIFSVSIDDAAVGMLLAFGGGVYLQVGAAECMPRVYEGVQSAAERVFCLAAFCVGTVAIGLVLLDHQHCSTAGAGHGH